MSRLPRLLGRLIGGLCLLSILAAAGAFYLQYREVEAGYQAQLDERAAQFESSRERMLADQRLLKDWPELHDQPCTADAGPFLNAFLPWDNRSADSWERPELSVPAPDWEAMEELHEELKDKTLPHEHWMDPGPDDPRLQALDLSWQEQLRGLRCWNITQNSPRADQDYDSFGELVNSDTLPVVRPLMRTHQLSLMQLALPLEDPEEDRARTLQVLEDSRQLALITLHSQTLLMGIVAAKMLEDEREAWTWLRAEERSLPPWEPVPEEVTEALQRLVAVSSGLADIMTPADQRDLIVSEDWRVGRCAGLREALWLSISMRGMLAEDYYRWLSELVDQAPALGCWIDDLSHHLQDDDLLLLHDPEGMCMTGEPCAEISLASTPRFIQRYVGMVLTAIAVPNPLYRYEDDEE